MTSTYSSIATTMWPPPSSETTSRLQRLQELEQMRKKRQIASGTLYSEPTDGGTRLSRRQQISGSIGMHKLLQSHEEKRKSIIGRRSFVDRDSSNISSSLSSSHGSLVTSVNYGGARPKNTDVASSMRKTVLSENESEYIGRDRSASLTNSEGTESAPLLRSHSATGLQSNRTGSFSSLVEGFHNNSFTHTSESVGNTSVSEDEEDIEDFKRSLLGVQNLINVPEREELSLQQSYPKYVQTTKEIDTSRLLIHHIDPQQKSFSLKKTESTSSAPNQQRIQNMVSESMKRLDSLFDTPTKTSTKSDTLPRNQRFQSRSERLGQSSRISSKVADVIPTRKRETSLKDDTNMISRTGKQDKNNTDPQADNKHELQCNTVHQVNHEMTKSENKQPIEDFNETENSGISGNKGNSSSQNYPASVSGLNYSEPETVQDLNDDVTQYKQPDSIDAISVNTAIDPKHENILTQSDSGHMTVDGENPPTGTGLVTSEPSTNLKTGTNFEENFNSFEVDNNDGKFDSTHNSYFIRSEIEDDLVNASNVGYFELDKNQYEQSDSNNIELTNDFPFKTTNEFLSYDENVRNGLHSIRNSYLGQNSDTFSSRTNRSMSLDYSSRLKKLPYTQKDQSEYRSYNSSRDNSSSYGRKSSLGVTGISQDALSRIDDLFGEKSAVMKISDFQSALPRRRARDSLVGSRPSILRSRSDAGESSRFEVRRTLNRTNSNDSIEEQTKDEQSDQFQSCNFEESQSSYRTSLLAEYQSKRDENASRIEGIRNRLKMYSDSNSHTSSTYHGELESNTSKYTRSRSVDLQTQDSFNTSQNSSDLISQINQLSSEISSEFLKNEDNDNVDSNKTLTPDTEINSEISQEQEDFVENIIDEDLTFSSSYTVEIGEVLVCTDDTKGNKGTNANIAVSDITPTSSVFENGEPATQPCNISEDLDSKVDVKDHTDVDMEKHFSDNSDEVDSKSGISNTSSNGSSKKKRNKKKVKKGSNSDLSKVLVSHPSELLKKGKKELNKNRGKPIESPTKKQAKKEEKSVSNKKGEKISPKNEKKEVCKTENGTVKHRKNTDKKNDKSPIVEDTFKNKKEDKKSPKKTDGLNKCTDSKKSPKKSKGDDLNKSTNSTDSQKSPSKFRSMFDTIIHALDRRSDTSSVTNSSFDDNKSLSSGEKTPVADEWEIIPEPSSDLNIIHEDNYATFEDEDLVQQQETTKRKMSDENSGISTDNYETASDHTISGASEYEEFYEAVPAELLGNAWKDIQNETERKEQFVYVCASSKVRVKKRKPKSDFRNRNENVNQWISANLYPGEKYPEQAEKVANRKYSENKELSQSTEPNCTMILSESEEQIQSVRSNKNSTSYKTWPIAKYQNDFQDQKEILQPSKGENLVGHLDLKGTEEINLINEQCEQESMIGVENVKTDESIRDIKKEELCISHIVNSKSETYTRDELDNDRKLSNSASVDNIQADTMLPSVHQAEYKSLENNSLDLKASDDAFTDTLVNALREKLCSCCQGVLLDVLKQTYFTRFQEISKINLTEERVLSNSLSNDSGKSNEKNDGLNTTETEIVPCKKKVKKLEVEDLLYVKPKKSDVTSEQCNNGNAAVKRDDKQLKLKQTTSFRMSNINEKPVITAKNDNFIGASGKISPQKQSNEIKVKGKIVTLDRNKKEGKVSPKSEQKHSPKSEQKHSPKSEQKYSPKSEQKYSLKSENKHSPKSEQNQKGNMIQNKANSDYQNVTENSSTKTEEECEEYKLPNLKDNPFIKSDKLRNTGDKSDLNRKNGNVTKMSVIKRSMSLNIDSVKPGSPSRTRNQSGNGTLGHLISPSSPKKELKSDTVINGRESSSSNSTVKDNLSSNNETLKDINSTNGKSNSPKSNSKKPSMFDHLNFAKSVCENLGPNDNDTKTDTISPVKSSESLEHQTMSKKTKFPARRTKSSTFGDTDIIDELDLSPEEAYGVPIGGDEEIAPHRINLINWDPTKLLNVLYTVKLNKDTTEDVSHQFVNMEGLMEKLPMNKKKATLLKTWKRRFFRAKDGWLHYYEGLSEDQTSNRDRPSDSVQLMGGKVEDLGSRVLGIDDGRGRFLMVRCPTEKEYGQWKLALESQTVNNVKATYVRPALTSPPHPEKKVVIIDIGSGGIRAGVMGAQPCLPRMFFPSVVACNKKTKELVIGVDAYRPDVRKDSTLVKLVEPSNRVDKDHIRPFAIDMEIMSAVFDYIFKGLKVDPAKYWIMLSTPYKLGDVPMTNLMSILTDKFHTKGVCMVMQSLLALYSYNATSGIIVDIGERMEILPIFDGVLIEGGVSRQAYGGQKICDSLNSSLTELKYNFFTPVDKLLVRYVMEQSCYVCDNYKEVKSKCDKDADSYQTTVYLNNFDLPDDAHMSVTHDLSCFKSPEGFFNTDLWGMDYPCVHKLVHHAIQSCPMDNRKHMYRAIYLSGGVTMLQGFAERLEIELKKLAPPSVVVEVHASPQRYHSAFIGAGTLLSNVQVNEQVFISTEEWKRDGAKAFRKWKGPS